MKKLNNKGFSLVELIIVVAIMVVLVGVLAPQFIKYVEKSKAAGDLENLQQLKTAIEVAYAEGSISSAEIAFDKTIGKITATLSDNTVDLTCPKTVDLKTKNWNVDVTYKYDGSSWDFKVVGGATGAPANSTKTNPVVSTKDVMGK